MTSRTPSRSWPPAEDQRAQTVIDFSIGISMFLIVVALVFASAPSVLQPFTYDSQEDTVLANRIASQLTEETLGAPDAPYMLDTACTTAFFGGPDPGGCRFDTGAPLEERVGLSQFQAASGYRQQIQLTIDGDIDDDASEERLCNDGNGDVFEQDDVSCSTVFEDGETPPAESNSVVVAHRVVLIDGHDATLRVRVW